MNLKTKNEIELFCHYIESDSLEENEVGMTLTTGDLEKMSEINELRKLINQKIEMFVGDEMANISLLRGGLYLRCYNGEKLLAQTNKIINFSSFLKRMKNKYKNIEGNTITFSLYTSIYISS